MCPGCCRNCPQIMPSAAVMSCRWRPGGVGGAGGRAGQTRAGARRGGRVSDQPAPAPLDAERLQAILDGSPFIHFCGMRVAALDPAAGSVVLAMELRPELERRQGTGQWHGGAIAGLIDTAGDAAVALGLGAVVPTINFRVITFP